MPTEHGSQIRIDVTPACRKDTLKLVAHHFLSISSLFMDRVIKLLAEVEFVRLQTERQTIKGVLPTVPYYEDMYDQLSEYVSAERPFNEAEQLALHLVDRLSKSPEKVDVLRHRTSAEKKLFERGIQIGTQGSYLIQRRSRGKDILLTPTYFSENADIFSDAVAAHGAELVGELLEALGKSQGWPLALIENSARIGEISISPGQVTLLKRLAQDGAVRPPSIKTTYSGHNYFLFTPTPTGAALSPTKRDVYERAMAIVAAVRQGQLLPRRYAIRSPGAVLYTLKTNLRLNKATTEATQQYRKLVHLRIGQLIDVGNGFAEFQIIDTPENREAIEIAYSLVNEETLKDIEVDDQARMALQRDQEYVESLIAASELRQREFVELAPEQQAQLDLLMLGAPIP